MNLTHFPRRFFAHLPTPLEPLKNLSSLLGGPNIWIKRDDCTGVAGGGNKTRKLEFLIGDALAKNCDTIITQGATQSNHVRQTAAVACKYGFKIVALLEDRTGSKDENHNHNGNVLLTNIFGAEIIRRAGGTDMAAEMVIVSEQLKAEGKKPYIIPGGGSNFVGALGYANCAFELMQQLNSQNIKIDHLVHATGSTGTQAGLIAGMEAINAHIPILGISVRQPKEAQEESVFKLARETAEKLDVQHALKKEKVVANSDYVGQGYGFPADSTLEAIKLLALHEGILLDPVYSGKGMAGLIGLIRLGHFKKGENVVFLHTGGAQALHGYLHDFH